MGRPTSAAAVVEVAIGADTVDAVADVAAKTHTAETHLSLFKCRAIKPNVALVESVALDVRGVLLCTAWHQLENNIVLAIGYLAVFWCDRQFQVALRNDERAARLRGGFDAGGLHHQNFFIRTNNPGSAPSSDRTGQGRARLS